MKTLNVDEVVTNLVDQVSQGVLKTVIASPDRDFKQVLSENMQLIMPLPEFGHWYFYSLKHYIDQYDSDPPSMKSLESRAREVGMKENKA